MVFRTQGEKFPNLVKKLGTKGTKLEAADEQLKEIRYRTHTDLYN